MAAIPISADAASASRPVATATGKRINVNVKAAGLKVGAASISASEASNRRVRRYTPSNNVDRNFEPVITWAKLNAELRATQQLLVDRSQVAEPAEKVVLVDFSA
jgi:hypothetical protein